MLNVHIRPESPADIQAIEALTVAAFLHAPHADHTEQFIIRDLRWAGALALSLVAELDGDIVGHVALSPVTLSDGSAAWYGLGPISVLPELQRRGIGSRLMLAALQDLRRAGAAGCVLVGDPAFYHRFGFKPEKALVLPGVPPQYFQALSFAGPLPRGIVTFHPAFDAKS